MFIVILNLRIGEISSKIAKDLETQVLILYFTSYIHLIMVSGKPLVDGINNVVLYCIVLYCKRCTALDIKMHASWATMENFGSED